MNRTIAILTFAAATFAAVPAHAIAYISDVMLVGGTKDEVNALKSAYQTRGWQAIDYDLNKGCGESSDWIYLLYKQEDSDGTNYGYITDFYLKKGASGVNGTLSYEDRTYTLVPYDGGSHFKEVKGDLNSNAGGASLHLYATRDTFRGRFGVGLDEHNLAVCIMAVNGASAGALGADGDIAGCDLNSGCGSETDDIYLHFERYIVNGAPFPGTGSDFDPFLIASTADWNALVSNVQDGHGADRCYRLTSSIGVSTMLGTLAHPFGGTFDGSGQTLTVNISGSEEGVAPFHRVRAATVKDLAVTGTVASTGYHAAGLVGLCDGGAITVSGCAVTADVNGTGYVGGIVGHGGASTLTIKDSFYGGTIAGFDCYAGGLLGWCDAAALTLHNDLFRGTFAPSGDGRCHHVACKNAGSAVSATVKDVYYPRTFTPTATGDNLVPGTDGKPLSLTRIENSWDLPVKAVDGNTYYSLRTGRGLPYSYGFETNDWGGWTCIKDGAYNTGIQITKALAQSGSRCFCFASSCHQAQYLISPEFDGRHAMTFTFYGLNVDAVTPFQVGYSLTTDEISAFTWYGEITGAEDNKWIECKMTFPKETKYVAIRVNAIDAGCVWLDSFDFEICPTPAPASLVVSSLTEQRATLSWTAPENEDTITGYTYQFKKKSDADWSAETTVDSATTSATFSGLQDETEYQFRVKTLYEVGESIYLPVNFTTTRVLPYVCGFENGMDGWRMVDCPWDWTKICADAARTGGNGFMFESTVTAPQYLFSPRLPDDSDLAVSFYYRSELGAGITERFQVGYSTTTDDVDSFTWGNEISILNWRWSLYENIFPAGTRYIAVRYNVAYGSELCLDDFCCERHSSLAKPTDLAAGGLTDQSAALTWTAPSAFVSGYVYQYRDACERAWSSEVRVSESSVLLDGLSANTTYEFRVKALYGDKASNYATASFLTEGPVETLPHCQGFENGMGGWRIVEGEPLTDIYDYDKDYVAEGDKSFKFDFNKSDVPQYLISPKLDCSTNAVVAFFYRSYRGSTFQVGYSATTKDLSAFTWCPVVTSTSAWDGLAQLLPAGTKYVAVKWTGGYFLYLDNVNIVVLPERPEQPVASDIAARRVKLSWSGESDTYDVQYIAPLFFDDFEHGLDRWTVVNQGGTEATDWQTVEFAPYLPVVSGKCVAIAKSHYEVGLNPEDFFDVAVDNWLITPQVTLDGVLRFWTMDDGNYHEHYEVWVSTNSNEIGSFTKIAEPGHVTNEYTWCRVSLDLSEYKGVKGYVAIRLNDYGKNFLAIDDFGIYAGEWTSQTVTGNSITLNNLAPHTSYLCEVRARSGIVVSDWSMAATFSTEPFVRYSEWAGDLGISGAWDAKDADGIPNVFRYVFDKPSGKFTNPPLLSISFDKDGRAVVHTPPVDPTATGFDISIQATDTPGGEGDATYPLDPSGETVIPETRKPARFFRLKATED